MTDELPGGSTPSQYALPDGAAELQDLIEYRDMNFALGNIFKAVYRMGSCSHSNAARDLRKIIWFANRELARHEIAQREEEIKSRQQEMFEDFHRGIVDPNDHRDVGPSEFYKGVQYPWPVAPETD